MGCVERVIVDCGRPVAKYVPNVGAEIYKNLWVERAWEGRSAKFTTHTYSSEDVAPDTLESELLVFSALPEIFAATLSPILNHLHKNFWEGTVLLQTLWCAWLDHRSRQKPSSWFGA